MECEDDDGRGYVPAWPAGRRGPGVEHELGTDGARHLPLDCASPVPSDTIPQQMHLYRTPKDHQNRVPPAGFPFMNNMDEISYWIYTKRAPCLMNYDNLIKKQSTEAQCSKNKPKSVIEEIPSPKIKKKRKLKILDDESVSCEKQQNVYFEVSQREKQNRPVMSGCKSDTLGSDVDFNIKKSSVQVKSKRAKLQKSSRTTIHKKNKVVTSTPKTTANLRRSLRQAQLSLYNNSHLNSSFEIFNSSIVNGNHLKNNLNLEQKSAEKFKKSMELLPDRDQTLDNKKNNTLTSKPKNIPVLNGQFEDLSDVSGFTANYIRSTKVQSNKTPRKMRCKPSRNLMKGSRQTVRNESSMIVCVNKSMNTGLPKTADLNCSTDSDNVINLVTMKSNDKCTKVNRSTSLLKFMDTGTKSKESVLNKVSSGKQKNKTNLNVSFQSKSSTSRYPKRYKNHTEVANTEEMNQSNQNAADKRGKISKNSSDFNNSDRKENPEDKLVSRTRSGRNIGLTLRQQENSVLVLSNSTEQVSSIASMNVASPNLAEQRRRKKRTPARQGRAKKSIAKSGQSLSRDSLRDKSGFAACFSDSDEDSEPLKRRKFFCA